MTNTAREAEIVMNTITRSPLYELRLSAIGAIESQASLAWIGMRPPRISSVIGDSASITGPGRIPANRQSVARMNMAASEHRSTSCAASAARLRGRPSRKGEGHGQRQSVGLQRDGETEAREDDADILDRGVGEQPLEVVLHHRIQDAYRGGDAADKQHDHTRRPRRLPQQIEYHADKTVDRDLGHNAAHQRRNMARLRRMGEWKPDMQRHEAGF